MDNKLPADDGIIDDEWLEKIRTKVNSLHGSITNLAEQNNLLQAKCDALEKERYETRLALRMLLKVFSKTAKSDEQAKFYLQADYILDKYHSVADVLRNEALSAGEGNAGMPHLAEPILSDEDVKAWEQSKKEDKDQSTSKAFNPDQTIICVECKTKPATTDYNSNGHYVCKLCDDSLNREFDNEYQ